MSFLILGLALFIQQFAAGPGQRRFYLSPVGLLAIFGLTHGLVELLDMLVILDRGSVWGAVLELKMLRVLLLAVSFYFLFKFGLSCWGGFCTRAFETSPSGPNETSDPGRSRLFYNRLPDAMLVIWLIVILFLLPGRLSNRWFTECSIYARYLLGFPGALSASVAFIRLNRQTSAVPKPYLVLTSLSFFFYAVFAGLVAPKADFLPSALLNYDSFYYFTRVPVQIFRSLCAVLITFLMLKILRFSRKPSSIRLKAMQHVFIAVVVPAFFIVSLVSYMIADSLIILSGRQYEKLASLAAENVKYFLGHVEEKVKHKLLFYLLSPSINGKDILSFIVRENYDIDGMSIVDPKEGVIIRVEKDASSSAITYESRVDEKRLRKVLEGFVYRITSDEDVFSLEAEGNRAVMTVDSKEVRIKIFLNSDEVYEVVSRAYGDKDWHALVLDDSGTAIMPPWKKHYGEAEILEHKGDYSGALGKTTREDGIYYNGFVGNMHPNKWSVITEIPSADIVLPIFRSFRGLLFGILGVYFSVIGVAMVFAQRVTKPINQIAEKVKLIGKGDFSQKLNVRTGDELQSLSEEVEKMAGELAQKRKMEQQIAQTEKVAAIGHLAAGIAHEINNPLGAILGYSQILLRRMKDGGDIEEVKTIEQQALGCKKIVEDLLNFSRPHKKVNVAVDINENIKESIALMPSPFLRDKLDISLELMPEPPKVLGDPDKLHQLFLNLILNAADAIEEKGRLEFRTSLSEKKDLLEISVRDNGCGIRREDIKNIFDPFFTTKDVGKGTGLGLSVSYGIVQEHGGRINVESEVGRGTVFYISFPAVQS